jgi:signal transduction histidine kinase
MAFTLVALLEDKARYPTVPPEFATHVGWLLFGFALVMLAWAWTRVESVRRALLALEDPRTFAVLRIGFAIMTIANFLNLAPYWRFLLSDEGIFDLAYAQERMGRSALRGWSPEEGFFDPWAIACFLWNKPSLLYMHGSPDFVVWHMMALFGVCTLFGLGVMSRTTGVVAWLLMGSIYHRNSLYWEGTDTVYRCFWLIPVRQDRPRVERRQLVALSTAAQARSARGSRRARRRPHPRADLPPGAGVAALAVHAAARGPVLRDRIGQDRRRVGQG